MHALFCGADTDVDCATFDFVNHNIILLWSFYEKMGIKITASEERMFRLRSCSEDDTIFVS